MYKRHVDVTKDYWEHDQEHKEYIEITKDNWEQYAGQTMEFSDSHSGPWFKDILVGLRSSGIYIFDTKKSYFLLARIAVPATKKPKPPTGVTKRTGVTVYTKIDGTTTESLEDALMQATQKYVEAWLPKGESAYYSIAAILIDDTKRKQFLEGAAKARKVTTAKKGQKQ